MTVSSISNQNNSPSVANQANTPAVTAIDKEIQAFQQQKEAIQKQIEKVKNSEKMDTKQKRELINEYQKQITEIDAEIRAKEAEKMKPKEVKPQNPQKDEFIKSQDSPDDALLNGAMNLQNLCSQFAGMVKLRSGIMRKIEIARSEVTGNCNLEKKMEEVYKLEDKKKELEKRMAKKMEEIQGEQDKQLKRAKVTKDTNDKDVKNEKNSSQEDQQGAIQEKDSTSHSDAGEAAVNVLA